MVKDVKTKTLKKTKMVSTPRLVLCVRPSNPSCAHPTTYSKLGRCYY
jgi:hypothetical protein|tara:strand:- start:302 stop:442 length:141 start_codon:yes stop_codon:yes gene_type:complete